MKKLLVLMESVGLCLAAVAMPTKNELKKVQGLVNELMSGDIQSMKSGKLDAAKVAANAEHYAQEADTDAAKFLLLKGAFGLYVKGGAYDEALRVLNVLTTEIKDVPDKVLLEIVVTKLKSISKKDGAAVFEYYERLERRMRLTEERVKIEKALKAKPDSKEMNREMALCLIGLEDWAGALAHFAKADGKEAEAAKVEAKGDTVAAANLWWDAAPAETDDAYRAHAAELYRVAVAAGKLTGLKLALAKKRIAEGAPDGAVPAVPAPTAPSVQTVASDPKESSAASLSPVVLKAASRKGGYDWTIPKNLKGFRSLDFDIGCEEKMTFIAVPPDSAGANWWGSQSRFKVEISRPFWALQGCVTVGQFQALGFKCGDRLQELVDACKGDRNVAVYAISNFSQNDKFFEELNARFGHQLPKGYVFRPPTFGERVVSAKRGGFLPKEGMLIKALHDKGFYRDCKTMNDLRYQFHNLREGPPYGALAFYAGQLRSDRQIMCLFVNTFLLDRISTPAITETAFPKAMPEIEKMLNCRGVLKDPFWYCADTEPVLRRCDGITWSAPLETLHWASHFISVVVGYDYVSEWKRQHGK